MVKRFWLRVLIPLCFDRFAEAYAQDGEWLSDLTVHKADGLPYGTSAVFPIDKAALAGCRAGGMQTTCIVRLAWKAPA